MIDEISEENFLESTPPELRETAENTTNNLLAAKSRNLYEKAYNKFKMWRKDYKTNLISEHILLTYFTNLSKKNAPSVCWRQYSFLRATILINDKINIAEYNKLLAFLKRNSENYKPKQAKTLTNNQLREFLENVSEEIYLLVKVATIFAIMGCLRIDELTKIEMSNLDDITEKKIIHVLIPVTKNGRANSFAIHPIYYDIVHRYLSLRPLSIKNKGRVFIKYDNRTRKCSSQVIGKNTMAKMPRQIAKFLNLPNADDYIGHAYRRTSASLVASAGGDMNTIKQHGNWKSTKVAESYIKDTVTNKMKVANLITSTIHGESNDQTPTTTSDRVLSKSLIFQTSHQISDLISQTDKATTTNTSVSQTLKKFRFQPKKPIFSKPLSTPSSSEQIFNLDLDTRKQKVYTESNIEDYIIEDFSSQSQTYKDSVSTLNYQNINSNQISEIRLDDYIIEDFISQSQKQTIEDPATSQNNVKFSPKNNYYTFNNCNVTLNIN